MFGWNNVAGALAALGLLSAGCDDTCVREVETSVVYTGKQAGTMYSRNLGPGSGSASGSSSPTDSDDAGNFRGGASSRSCSDVAGSMDAPGEILEGWVDVDGDDQARCGCDGGVGLCGLRNLAACGPEVGDPQGRKEYTLRAKGKTLVTLELGDF
ncbi:MAG: hypothetical protein JWN04_5917 [Myxococcaceae bacterium]|nr:hypothetical protein [Myxococcaceae bacterium]